MKKRLFFALLISAATLTGSAQGYKDGIEYYKAGQYGNAITLLERNLNNPSTDKAMAYYYLGQAYILDKDYTKAKDCFEKGIAANANNGYNYVGLGALALINKDKSAAGDYFKKAQSLAKKNTEVLVDIARAYYNADPVAFDKEVEKYLEKARKDSKFKEPAIYVFEGDRKFDSKDYNGAATEYEQAITFDEDNPEGYVKYANTYYYVAPEYAIDKLKELLQRNPNSALAQRELAEKYYLTGQWTLAAKQYGDYIDNPNHFPEDMARYAVLLYSGEQYEKCLEAALKALQQKHNDVTLSRLVIRSLDNLDRKSEALAKAKEFFAMPSARESLNAADYRIYGNLLQASKDSTAIDVIIKGLEKFPKDASLNLAASDYYLSKRDLKPAADYYETYVSLLENPKRNDNYGVALRDRFVAATNAKDNPELSKEYANKGLTAVNKALDGLDPENRPHQYLHLRGQLYVLANGGEPDANAVKDFEDEIAILDKDPELANPANPKNYIDEYILAYSYIRNYCLSNGDTAKADATKTQIERFKQLKGQK